MDLIAVYFSMIPATTPEKHGAKSVNIRFSSGSTMQLTACCGMKVGCEQWLTPLFSFKSKEGRRIERESSKLSLKRQDMQFMRKHGQILILCYSGWKNVWSHGLTVPQTELFHTYFLILSSFTKHSMLFTQLKKQGANLIWFPVILGMISQYLICVFTCFLLWFCTFGTSWQAIYHSLKNQEVQLYRPLWFGKTFAYQRDSLICH